MDGAPGGQCAVLRQVQIQHEILDVVESLVPFLGWLDIHRADFAIALAPEFGGHGAPDKTTGAGYDYRSSFMACSTNDTRVLA